MAALVLQPSWGLQTIYVVGLCSTGTLGYLFLFSPTPK